VNRDDDDDDNDDNDDGVSRPRDGSSDAGTKATGLVESCSGTLAGSGGSGGGNDDDDGDGGGDGVVELSFSSWKS
jgi:hypothetical protein